MSITRIALLGCSKAKIETTVPVAADELYSASQLFSFRARHVESRGLKYAILSAHYGLLLPWARCVTYNKSLADLDKYGQAKWALDVTGRLVENLTMAWGMPELKNVVIEIHAGRLYSGTLKPVLESIGIQVELPVAGLGIGEQLSFYKRAS